MRRTLVKRRFLVVAAGVAAGAVSLGCSVTASHADPSTPTTTFTSPSTSPSSSQTSTSPGSSPSSSQTTPYRPIVAQPKLLIDGQDQGIGGQQVYCRVVPAVNTHGGSNYVVYITLGNVGGAQLTLDGENAQVQQFDFNKIPLNLLFQKNNKTGNSAQAT